MEIHLETGILITAVRHSNDWQASFHLILLTVLISIPFTFLRDHCKTSEQFYYIVEAYEMIEYNRAVYKHERGR